MFIVTEFKFDVGQLKRGLLAVLVQDHPVLLDTEMDG